MKGKSVRSILWTQGWGSYPGHTVVLCGFTDIDEVIEIMRKDECYEWAVAIGAHKDHMNQLKCNYFTQWEYKSKTYSVLNLLHWKKDLEHYSVLAHELIHAVTIVLRDRLDLLKENEAFAYQFQFLFKTIAQQLNDWHDHKKVS